MPVRFYHCLICKGYSRTKTGQSAARFGDRWANRACCHQHNIYRRYDRRRQLSGGLWYYLDLQFLKWMQLKIGLKQRKGVAVIPVSLSRRTFVSEATLRSSRLKKQNQSFVILTKTIRYQIKHHYVVIIHSRFCLAVRDSCFWKENIQNRCC